MLYHNYSIPYSIYFQLNWCYLEVVFDFEIFSLKMTGGDTWLQIPASRTSEAGSNFEKQTPDFEKWSSLNFNMIRRVPKLSSFIGQFQNFRLRRNMSWLHLFIIHNKFLKVELAQFIVSYTISIKIN